MGKLGSATSGTLVAVLANPYVAFLLGAALGVGMLLLSAATARTMTADDPQIGFVRVAVLMVVRLLVALGVLAVYYVWIRPGLVPFGVGLIVGFLVMIAVALLKLGRRSSPSVR